MRNARPSNHDMLRGRLHPYRDTGLGTKPDEVIERKETTEVRSTGS